MMKSFLDELSASALSLSEGERRLIAPPLHWVTLANGDADFHDNLIFFGIKANETEPVLVVKVPRLVENGWMLKKEYDHLVELWNCIGEQAARYVPKPYELRNLQGRPVLIISYVSGESLTRSRQTFWEDGQQVSALAKEAGRTLRELNRLTETRIPSGDLFYSDFQRKADKFRELFKLRSEEDRVLSRLAETIGTRSQGASHKVILQGDFWHGNMIRDDKRGTLMFIDWQFARWSVDVSLDVYFFLLAAALSATGKGPAEQRAKSAFHLLRQWANKIIPEYLAAYGTPDHYLLLPQKDGMLLCCVEKAVRSALEFGYSHPDDLMWRFLFAELLTWPVEE